MIIDFHAHIFPEKIAEKASKGIEKFYDMPMRSDGRVQSLLEQGEKAAVDRYVVHSVATIPEQVESINQFIIDTVQQYPEKLIGFASMHPLYKNIEKQLDTSIEAGLKGVKIHPDFQKFLMDDEAAFPMYECIEGRLPLLVHTGDYRYEYSKPERLARVLDRFPRLTVIGAHFGGWSVWGEAANILHGRGVYVDTSSSLYALSPEEARHIIDQYGADHVLFGTDFPMWTALEELEMLAKIPMSFEEREGILYKNAVRLLQL